jgi:cytidylate kinase
MLTPDLDRRIAQQIKRWENARRSRAASAPRGPVIAVSRLPGCGGRELARDLAKKLGFDFFDKELLHQIAASSHLSEILLKTVDERARSAAQEWVEALITRHYVSGEYFHHLSKALMAISEHGRAVVLGRGASWILPRPACLRVLLVAPLEARVRRVAEERKLGAEDAKRLVVQEDSDRRAFIRRHFHAELLDPLHHDLTIDLSEIPRDAAMAVIETAWQGKSRLAVPAL